MVGGLPAGDKTAGDRDWYSLIGYNHFVGIDIEEGSKVGGDWD